MSMRWGRPFTVLNSTAPSFLVSVTSTASLNTLDNAAWQGPSNRTIRVVGADTPDFYMAIGSSTIAASSTGSMLVLGGAVEAFHLDVQNHYISFICATATALTVNVTLGYGN